MSATNTYPAQARTTLGTRAAAKLRAAGTIPVTVSRPGHNSTHLQIDEKSAAHLAAHVVHLCKLDVAGKELIALRAAVVKNCLTDKVEHIDLIEVDEKSEIKVEVAIHPDARNCPGVKAGGIVEQRARKIKVFCKVNAIPDRIDLDLGEVQITETVYAEKLKLPAGLKLASPGKTPILTIVIPRQFKVEEVAPAAGTTATPAAAAAAPADGKAAAGAKPDAKAAAKAPAADAKKK